MDTRTVVEQYMGSKTDGIDKTTGDIGGGNSNGKLIVGKIGLIDHTQTI